MEINNSEIPIDDPVKSEQVPPPEQEIEEKPPKTPPPEKIQEEGKGETIDFFA